MTETPHTPPPKPPAPVAPAGRSVDEIKADPLVASSVARVNGAIINDTEDNDVATGGGHQLIAGTAWLF